MGKSVKKVLAATMVLCLAFAMVACSGNKYADSEYVGEWKIASVEAMGMTIQMNGSFEFKANGKVDMTLEGDTQTAKWDETNDGIEIKDSKDSISGKMEGENLVISMSKEGMEMKLNLKKV